jgi:hypothetical protein
MCHAQGYTGREAMGTAWGRLPNIPYRVTPLTYHCDGWKLGRVDSGTMTKSAALTDTFDLQTKGPL